MAIKESLREADQLLEHVSVRGKANMRHMLAAMERIEAVANAIEEAEKGALNHAAHHDEQRKDTQHQLDDGAGQQKEPAGDRPDGREEDV